jgi:hypothetical protein
VTNSTTEIGIIKLLTGKKCKIISIAHEGVYRGVEAWLLPLTYATFKVQWFTARTARSIQFQR